MHSGHGSEFGLLLRDLWRILGFLSRRRRVQLAGMLFLQIIGALLEVLGVGAIVPFLGALTEPGRWMSHPLVSPVLAFLGIATAAQFVSLCALGFGLTIVVVNILRIATLWVEVRLTSVIGTDFSMLMITRLLAQKFQFYIRANSSYLISAALNDLNAALSVLQNLFMIATQSLVILAIISALLLLYDATIVILVFGVVSASYYLVARFARFRLFINGKIVSDSYASQVLTLQEGLGGIRDILLHSMQERYISHYGLVDKRYRQASATLQLLRMVPRYLIECIGIVLLCGVTVILAFGRQDLQGILPVLGGIAVAANRLLPACQQVYAAIAGFQSAHISITRALDAISRPCHRIEPESQALVPKPEFRHAIALDHVWFHYDSPEAQDRDPEWVLSDISIEIPLGKTVAIVGETGAGKSTLSDIILGLLPPSRGGVTLDGRPVSEIGLAAWGKLVAHVPQSVYLTDASIRENIAFGVRREEIDQALVEECAKAARIGAFVEGLPNGYDQIVGERGVRLSGGQRQRLGIARALYKNASVIIFDEATSALDNVTEREVMDAIYALGKERTVILIAHRLSTIQSADIIYELAAGRVVASGTFDELVLVSDSFFRMVDSTRRRA